MEKCNHFKSMWIEGKEGLFITHELKDGQKEFKPKEMSNLDIRKVRQFFKHCPLCGEDQEI